MRKLLRQAALTAYVAGVALALGFGATQAFEFGTSSCEWDPPTFLGECLGEINCQRTCEFYLGWLGECDGEGCCVCAI